MSFFILDRFVLLSFLLIFAIRSTCMNPVLNDLAHTPTGPIHVTDEEGNIIKPTHGDKLKLLVRNPIRELIQKRLNDQPGSAFLAEPRLGKQRMIDREGGAGFVPRPQQGPKPAVKPFVRGANEATPDIGHKVPPNTFMPPTVLRAPIAPRPSIPRQIVTPLEIRQNIPETRLAVNQKIGGTANVPNYSRPSFQAHNADKSSNPGAGSEAGDAYTKTSSMGPSSTHTKSVAPQNAQLGEDLPETRTGSNKAGNLHQEKDVSISSDATRPLKARLSEIFAKAAAMSEEEYHETQLDFPILRDDSHTQQTGSQSERENLMSRKSSTTGNEQKAPQHNAPSIVAEPQATAQVRLAHSEQAEAIIKVEPMKKAKDLPDAQQLRGGDLPLHPKVTPPVSHVQPKSKNKSKNAKQKTAFWVKKATQSSYEGEFSVRGQTAGTFSDHSGTSSKRHSEPSTLYQSHQVPNVAKEEPVWVRNFITLTHDELPSGHSYDNYGTKSKSRKALASDARALDTGSLSKEAIIEQKPGSQTQSSVTQRGPQGRTSIRSEALKDEIAGGPVHDSKMNKNSEITRVLKEALGIEDKATPIEKTSTATTARLTETGSQTNQDEHVTGHIVQKQIKGIQALGRKQDRQTKGKAPYRRASNPKSAELGKEMNDVPTSFPSLISGSENEKVQPKAFQALSESSDYGNLNTEERVIASQSGSDAPEKNKYPDGTSSEQAALRTVHAPQGPDSTEKDGIPEESYSSNENQETHGKKKQELMLSMLTKPAAAVETVKDLKKECHVKNEKLENHDSLSGSEDSNSIVPESVPNKIRMQKEKTFASTLVWKPRKDITDIQIQGGSSRGTAMKKRRKKKSKQNKKVVQNQEISMNPASPEQVDSQTIPGKSGILEDYSDSFEHEVQWKRSKEKMEHDPDKIKERLKNLDSFEQRIPPGKGIASEILGLLNYLREQYSKVFPGSKKR